MKKAPNIFKDLYTNKYFEILPYFREQKAQKFTTLILTLLALSIFGVAAINPTVSTITQLQKQLEDNRFVNERLEQKILNLRTLQQRYLGIENDLTTVEKAVPKKPTIPTFIGQINALAEESNIQLTRLQSFEVELSKKQTGDNTFSSFSFALEAKGSYENLVRFLYQLSQFDRLITTDTISLNTGTVEDRNLRLGVRGKAFFKP